MQRYKNLQGDSGVSAYEIAPRSITVQFRTGHVYVYNYSVPGKDDVEKMKVLASAGRGLGTYISTTVKKRYAAKQR